MLLDIQSRGVDATGVAYPTPDGKFQIHKLDIPAAVFCRQRLCVPKRQTTAIMHTRFATQGDESNNDNNHPIPAGTVVGVHNGMLWNDDQLFADIKEVVGRPVRRAQVDSEAIFAALGYIDQPVTDTLEQVRGSAAIAWYDRAKDSDPEVLHLARLNQSPLVVCETEGGSVLFASTKTAILAGLAAGRMTPKKIREIEEGVYLSVLDGEIQNVRTFTPPKSYRYVNTGGRGRVYTPQYDDWQSEYEWQNQHRALTSNVYALPNIGDRLTAEVQEVGAGEDVDDARYEAWLHDNSRKLSEMERYRKAPYISTGNLDVEHVIPVPTETEYLNYPHHVDRENAIEKWCNGMQATAEAIKDTAVNLKALARPGHAVRCEVNGTPYIGHILRVPETFPYGDFVLRLFVPNNRRKHGYEAILVNKPYYEFQSVEERKAINA